MAQAFSFQGKLYNDDGISPLVETVTLDIKVFDPSGTCLLYHQRNSGVDLSLNPGVFAIDVGSAIGSGLRVAGSDPGLSMARIFSNQADGGRSVASSECASGYTPQTGQARRLRVNSGANLSQLSLETLTKDTEDASTLHHHDALYLRAAETGLQSLGSGITTTTGSIGVGTATPWTRVEVTSTGASEIGLNISNSGASAVGVRVEGSEAGTGNLMEFYEDDNAPPPLLGLIRKGICSCLPADATPQATQAITKQVVDDAISGVTGGKWYISE